MDAALERCDRSRRRSTRRLVVGLGTLALAIVITMAVSTALAKTTPPDRAPRPTGAAEPGTDEWYSVPLPSGRVAALGVYRPVKSSGRSVLVLHGRDGPRRLYEDLSSRFAAEGFTAVAACWFSYSVQEHDDAYGCPGIGEFHGAEATTVADVAAIVDAAERIPGVDGDRLGIIGQSYGARMALLRAAATGRTEPVVSSCGYLAAQPLTVEAEQPVYPFPADPDVAAGIVAPVLIVHGDADPIIPVGQAVAFAAAMDAAGHPAQLITYGSPAGHSIPWDIVTSLDDPGRLLRDRLLDDAVTFLRKHLEPIRSHEAKERAEAT